MQRANILLGILFLFSSTGYSQESGKEKGSWGIGFSGFVNSQVFYDTRQVVQAREGMVILLPQKPEYDRDGNDIHAHASLNQLSMTTRLRGNITGPDALGARTNGVIEGDFTGQSNRDNNGFRLREAWVKLTWRNRSVLTGLYWHPLYTPEVRPHTIALNTGAPFHPFSRHNQVRFTQEVHNIKIIAVAASQRDYASDGPAGRSSKYMRDAVVPNLDLQFQYYPGKHLFGFGIDYKVLQPRLSAGSHPDSLKKTNRKIHSFAAIVFAKIDLRFAELKFGAVWGQNMTEHIMIGGYVEKPDRSHPHSFHYANANQSSVWTDISSRGQTFRAGIFAGYGNNLDRQEIKAHEYYGNFPDLVYAFRVSPRLQYYAGKLMLASEFEYTAAAYALDKASNGLPGTELTGNLRILLAAFYFF